MTISPFAVKNIGLGKVVPGFSGRKVRAVLATLAGDIWVASVRERMRW